MRYPHIRYCLSLLTVIVLLWPLAAQAQENKRADSLKALTSKHLQDSVLSQQQDITDLYRTIMHPGKEKDATKHSGIIVIPNIAANPTIGLQGGIKAVAGRVLGHVPGTYMSVASTSASATTKGILYFYIVHNVFTPGNKWNFQGSIVASKSVVPDYGLGMRKGTAGNAEEALLINTAGTPYVWHSQYYNFREKVYREVRKNLFAGGGIEFNIRRKISNPNDVPFRETPYGIYNQKYGYDSSSYMSNGFLLNLEYTTRDNQNRAYKGMYADVGIRLNQKWIGSTKNAAVLTGDLRKYISLSRKNPETVLALWTWGSYVLNGSLPYLELPGSGRDASFRSGRGYVAGYYKSTHYLDTEAEFRFPITGNKLLSGVTFVSMQTANNLVNARIFDTWQPAGGAGLRILFNKATRTNLCLDYAFGRYGAKGFFLGLNEAF